MVDDPVRPLRDARTMTADVLSWQVGHVRVRRIEERVAAVPHGSLLPEHVVDLVERERPWIDPFVADDGRILLSVHSFVVESAGVTIVVDTCVGDHGERPLPPGGDEFLEQLADAVDGGLNAVDMVLCTHLHFDHVGWNTRRDPTSGELVLTFPNARYLVTATELATYGDHDHHGIGAVSVEPIHAAGRLVVVEPDHQLTPEVRLVPTPGHTPGHVSVVIESAGVSAIITGDAIHSPIQVAHPDVSAEHFDSDSEQARATRRRLLAKLADTGTLVLGTHFPPPTAGRVVTDGDRAVFALEE